LFKWNRSTGQLGSDERNLVLANNETSAAYGIAPEFGENKLGKGRRLL
jgi:hypothetical protein